MLLSELTRLQVVDVDGHVVGRVFDALLVQDGAQRGKFGAAARVEGLTVGRSALGTRLGYHRAGVTGPAPLSVLLEWLDRRARYVPWSEVAELGDDVIRLKCRATDLGEPPRT